MIRNITLVGTEKGFKALGPLLFEISAKNCFRQPSRGQKFIFSILAVLGIDLGVFRAAESIAGHCKTHRASVFEL